MMKHRCQIQTTSLLCTSFVVLIFIAQGGNNNVNAFPKNDNVVANIFSNGKTGMSPIIADSETTTTEDHEMSELDPTLYWVSSYVDGSMIKTDGSVKRYNNLPKDMITFNHREHSDHTLDESDNEYSGVFVSGYHHRYDDLGTIDSNPVIGYIHNTEFDTMAGGAHDPYDMNSTNVTVNRTNFDYKSMYLDINFDTTDELEIPVSRMMYEYFKVGEFNNGIDVGLKLMTKVTTARSKDETYVYASDTTYGSRDSRGGKVLYEMGDRDNDYNETLGEEKILSMKITIDENGNVVSKIDYNEEELTDEEMEEEMNKPVFERLDDKLCIDVAGVWYSSHPFYLYEIDQAPEYNVTTNTTSIPSMPFTIPNVIGPITSMYNITQNDCHVTIVVTNDIDELVGTDTDYYVGIMKIMNVYELEETDQQFDWKQYQQQIELISINGYDSKAFIVMDLDTPEDMNEMVDAVGVSRDTDNETMTSEDEEHAKENPWNSKPKIKSIIIDHTYNRNGVVRVGKETLGKNSTKDKDASTTSNNDNAYYPSEQDCSSLDLTGIWEYTLLPFETISMYNPSAIKKVPGTTTNERFVPIEISTTRHVTAEMYEDGSEQQQQEHDASMITVSYPHLIPNTTNTSSPEFSPTLTFQQVIPKQSPTGCMFWGRKITKSRSMKSSNDDNDNTYKWDYDSYNKEESMVNFLGIVHPNGVTATTVEIAYSPTTTSGQITAISNIRFHNNGDGNNMDIDTIGKGQVLGINDVTGAAMVVPTGFVTQENYLLDTNKRILFKKDLVESSAPRLSSIVTWTTTMTVIGTVVGVALGTSFLL